MKSENAITAYWNEIQSGGVTVGKWIRQLYDVLMQGISENRWFFDERLANNAIGFIHRYCHHYKGKLAPRRIRLDLWERASISDIFGIVDGTGKRQFTEVFWVVGRKQGNSLTVEIHGFQLNLALSGVVFIFGALEGFLHEIIDLIFVLLAGLFHLIVQASLHLLEVFRQIVVFQDRIFINISDFHMLAWLGR